MATRKPGRRKTRIEAGKRSRARSTPEEVAQTAVAHDTSATPSGDKVKLALTVYLSREQAERLTTRAIREGKNLEALVAEILEAVISEPAGLRRG